MRNERRFVYFKLFFSMLEIVFCSLGPNAYITRANAPNAKNEESLVQGEAQLYGQKKNNHFPVFLVASR